MPRKRRNSGFWECMTAIESECWEWQGYRDPAGYGQVRIDGKLRKTHRHAFELIHGYRPNVVRHTCDNPPCCNPAHLLDGTHADNVADKMAKGRGRWNPAKGEACNFAKLTTETVKQIRADYDGGMTQVQIAAKHHIHQTQVSNIVRRKHWKEAA